MKGCIRSDFGTLFLLLLLSSKQLVYLRINGGILGFIFPYARRHTQNTLEVIFVHYLL